MPTPPTSSSGADAPESQEILLRVKGTPLEDDPVGKAGTRSISITVQRGGVAEDGFVDITLHVEGMALDSVAWSSDE